MNWTGDVYAFVDITFRAEISEYNFIDDYCNFPRSNAYFTSSGVAQLVNRHPDLLMLGVL